MSPVTNDPASQDRLPQTEEHMSGAEGLSLRTPLNYSLIGFFLSFLEHKKIDLVFKQALNLHDINRFKESFGK